MKKALILLGCPESPSQTPLAIYAAYQLELKGLQVTVAGTPSALKMLEISDPNKQYLKHKTDIESCLDTLEEETYDILLGFAHNDAAVSYFITFYHILQVPAISVVFARDPVLLQELEKEVTETTKARIVSARAYHNPTPLKVRLDQAINELVI